ncbi:MAG: Fe-S cluster assembly protein SufD [bacterium]
MTSLTDRENGLRAAWEAFEGAGAVAPGKLRDIRQHGFRRFERLGFPSLKDEEWRFTDVSPIAAGSFALGSSPEVPLAARDVAPWLFEGLDGPRLVFVNGRFEPSLSDLRALGRGAVATTLAEAGRTHAEILAAHLDRLASPEEDAFGALSSAFLADGLFVHVPEGVHVRSPIHALFLFAPDGAPEMTHPRTLVVAGRDSSVTLLEDHVTLGDGVTFTNPLTEVVLGDGAVASHYHLGRGSERAYRISTLHVEQGAHTDFASHTVLVGGALVRHNVFPVLNGEHSESLLNGLYLPRGTQHHDMRMRVRHAKGACHSRQHYRGILDGKAKAMFTGRIIVDEGAQKTDAVQSNKNLLLSEDAMVETKPQLEIYADDVKCTHGATIGQIDDESIFYCRARGIPEAEARRLLVFAFANEILERMEVDAVRTALRSMVSERLTEPRVAR